MLHELALSLFKTKPYLIFALLLWIFHGKAYLKKKIAEHTNLDATSLPYNLDLLLWIKAQKEIGREIVLCTASDIAIARAIASHLKIFHEVLASDGLINLSGSNKANCLIEKYGHQGFDYIGNSQTDMPVWAASKNGVVVNGSRKLSNLAAAETNVVHIIPAQKVDLKSWVKVFRLHQWVKNLLLFVPLIAAHQTVNLETIINLAIAFLSFGLCASSVYIANDLFDLESDRKHFRKRFRPFASGQAPIWLGLILSPILALLSFSLAHHVNADFLGWILIYFTLTCAYSWVIKRLVLVDCLTLAILYTLRIIAGGSATDIPLSFWLLAFSIFTFLSLAFLKRYAELKAHSPIVSEQLHGRGYFLNDITLVQQLGITSGYSGVLVLALYLNSENVMTLFQTPQILWASIPLMLLWISWMWLKAQRDLMNDDPIVFALKDRVSLLIGALFLSIFVLARVW